MEIIRGNNKIRLWFLIFLFFIIFSSIFIYLRIAFASSYYITIRSEELSGSSTNLGSIYIDDNWYTLPQTIYLLEGQHSILYVSHDEYIFQNWYVEGAIDIGSSLSSRGNIINVKGDCILEAQYFAGPQLHVEIINPENYDVINVSLITLEVKITAENLPVSQCQVNLFVNHINLGTVFSNEQGAVSKEIELEPSKVYLFWVEAKKTGYTSVISQQISFETEDEYGYKIFPDENEIIFTSTLSFKASFSVNNILINNAKVTFYLDDDIIGYDYTNTIGIAYFSTLDIDPGNHSIYAIFEYEEKIITSKKHNFTFYGDVELIINDITINDVSFYDGPKIRFSAKTLSNSKPVPNVRIYYYVNDTLIGVNNTDQNGYSYYHYFTNLNETIEWYISFNLENIKVEYSDPKLFIPLHFKPQLKTNVIYPTHGISILSYSEYIYLNCRSSINDVPQQNVMIMYFVNEDYLGYEYSDQYGLTSFQFFPPQDDSEYKWYTISVMEYCDNYTSTTHSFYFPVEPQNVNVKNSYITNRRADIDSIQYIGYKLVWENDTYVSYRDIEMNDGSVQSTNETGWVIFPVTNSEVGKITYNINRVLSDGVKNILHDPHIEIIWDQVVFSTQNNMYRVDIGETIEPQIQAYYEYDGIKFKGRYFYNMDLYSSVTCRRDIFVNKIIDDLYSLTKIKSDNIFVIWDRIIFSVNNMKPRYQIGSNMNFEFNGIYEYDNSEFVGECNLVFDDLPISPGIYEINNLLIDDEKYNLSKYLIIDRSLFFDSILFDAIVDTKSPGKINYVIKPFFSYDGSVVNGSVFINRKKAKYNGQNGEYTITLNTWNIVNKINIEVDYYDFNEVNSFNSIMHYENGYFLFNMGFFPLSIIVVYYMVFSKKMTKKP